MDNKINEQLIEISKLDFRPHGTGIEIAATVISHPVVIYTSHQNQNQHFQKRTLRKRPKAVKKVILAIPCKW